MTTPPGGEPYVVGQRISLSQVDAAGILYFARVFEIAHLAFERFLGARGLPMSADITTSEWLLPVVHAEADYRSPMRLGDEVSVEVRVEARGRSSITFGFRVVGPSGELCALVRHVHVAIDRASFRSRDLPDVVARLADPGESS